MPSSNRSRALLALALALATVWLGGASALAAGSANLWPSGAPGSRANSEWRTDSYGGGVMLRRTLLHVYAQAGEFILMGSSARGVASGGTVGNILAYDPGLVTGPIGTETIPGAASFSCNTQAGAALAPANQGRILNRAAELAGPDTIPVGGVVGGYTPCYYLAPSTGVYSIVMLGPLGSNTNTDAAVSADVALAAAGDFSAAQGNSTAAWDVTVRSSLLSAANIDGRVFTYYLTLFTAGNGRLVYPTVYAATDDGYRYSIDLRGMDPNGWVTYGNQVGFLDSDGLTPLYRDAVSGPGGGGQLTVIQGNVKFAVPKFPLFFEPPADVTLTALGIPLTPTAPTIGPVTFTGNVSGNTSTVNSGGTFSYTSNVSGIYDITISADGVNFDPTLPANRRLRGLKPSGAQTVTWNGQANSGAAFAVGSYTFHASVHGGEYHFPFIDVENSIVGGPTLTLLNPIGGVCPPWNGGCKGGFYDDRVYQTIGGTTVQSGGTVGNTLCGLNPPATNHSDPLLGYDTSGGQRAFGANPGTNTNVACTGSFGDAKGMDLWTYTPSSTSSNLVNIVAPIADIAIGKTVNIQSPSLGSNVTFTITATDMGPDPATGVAVSDALPAGLTFVSSLASVGSYNSGTGVWTIGPLANGASATLQIVATVTSTTPITNTATKSAEVEGDPNPANDSASVTLNTAADIGVTKTVDNATPNLGSNVTFTIIATNRGPDAASGLAVTDPLPLGLVYVSSTVTAGSYNPGTGVWTVGSLANLATATLQVVATITTTGLVTNTATKSAENEADPNSANNSATASVTGQAADIGITKVVDNPTPNLGSNVTFTVVATNTGPSNATGVAVTDILPLGLAYVSSTVTAGSYNPGTGIWTIGGMANPSSATLRIIATVNTIGPVTNTAAKSAEDQPDPNPSNNSASAGVSGQIADIAVTKTVDNATPNLGSNVTFTVTAVNNGPSNATGVAVSDVLPVGLIFVSSLASVGTYSAGTGTWTIGPLANGATATLQIVATVNTTSTVMNTATKSAEDQPDPNLANDTFSVSVAGQAADIAINKSVDNATPNVGSNVTFTITATNNGASNATGVAVTDLLPAGLTLVTATPSAGTSYVPGTGIWTIGNLANAATATLQIVATVGGTTTVINTATKTAENQPDPNPGNNAASVSVAGQSADIAVTKIVDFATPNVGNSVTFTVSATNNGPSNATGVAVTDVLPPGLTLLLATPSTGSYNPATGVWTIGNLANTATATLQLTAMVTTANTVTNTAAKTAEDQPDANPGNNAASASVTGQSADIAVTKTVNIATPNLGGNVTFTVTATNNGPSNATGVAATDVLPAGLAFVSSTVTTGSYNSTTGVWTIGNLANTGTATLQITATVTTTNPVVNIASRSAGNQPDPNGANDVASVVVGGQSADIVIAKVADNPTPNLGANVTYTVTATNSGPSNATGVAVTDLLPAGLSLVLAMPSAGAYNSTTGVWTIGNLANGASATLQIVATVRTTNPITNTAAKTAENQPDPNGNNDAASATVTGQAADLGLTKTVTNATPSVGTNVTFTVVITNHGPNDATGVQVSDPLPAGLTFVSASPSQGSYSPATGLWTVNNLTNSASATLLIVATVTVTTPVTNTAVRAAGSPADPVLANDSASVQVTGSTVPGLPNDGAPPVAEWLAMLLLPAFLVGLGLAARRRRR